MVRGVVHVGTLIKEQGGVLQIGKHRLRLFNEMIRDDPDYADWAASLEAPSELMIGFQKYVQRQRKRPREAKCEKRPGMARARFSFF